MPVTAETYIRETVTRTGDGDDTPPRPAGPLPFRPEVFFTGRTEGAGVARDLFGRITRRCRISTDGAVSAAGGAIRLEETFTYDDGEVDVWRWTIRPSFDGRYIAAEAKAGSGIEGGRQGEDYVITFRRPVGDARGLFAPHFATRFTLLEPDLALKRVQVSLFGAPLGSLTAIQRRV